jgi:hypothetical protein
LSLVACRLSFVVVAIVAILLVPRASFAQDQNSADEARLFLSSGAGVGPDGVFLFLPDGQGNVSVGVVPDGFGEIIDFGVSVQTLKVEQPPTTVTIKNEIVSIISTDGGRDIEAKLLVQGEYFAFGVAWEGSDRPVAYVTGWLVASSLTPAEGEECPIVYLSFEPGFSFATADEAVSFAKGVNGAVASASGERVSPIDGTKGNDRYPAYMPNRPTPGRDIQFDPEATDEQRDGAQQCYWDLLAAMRARHATLKTAVDQCSTISVSTILQDAGAGALACSTVGAGIGCRFGIPGGPKGIIGGCLAGGGIGGIIGGLGGGLTGIWRGWGLCEKQAWESYNNDTKAMIDTFIKCLKQNGAEYKPGESPRMPPTR